MFLQEFRKSGKYVVIVSDDQGKIEDSISIIGEYDSEKEAKEAKEAFGKTSDRLIILPPK